MKTQSDHEDSDSEQFDRELDSDDDITIILNIRIPQASQPGQPNQYPEFFHRSVTHDQFSPTNPIVHPILKFPAYDPENEDKDEPRPWRDNPKTMPDYFNYGFTERVWEAYKFKQITIRRLITRNPNVLNKNRTNHKYKNIGNVNYNQQNNGNLNNLGNIIPY